MDVVRKWLVEEERDCDRGEQRDAIRRDDDVALTDRAEEAPHGAARQAERAVLKCMKEANVDVVKIRREDIHGVAILSQREHELLVANRDAPTVH